MASPKLNLKYLAYPPIDRKSSKGYFLTDLATLLLVIGISNPTTSGLKPREVAGFPPCKVGNSGATKKAPVETFTYLSVVVPPKALVACVVDARARNAK